MTSSLEYAMSSFAKIPHAAAVVVVSFEMTFVPLGY